MECGGQGRGSKCEGPPSIRCHLCQAIAYCSPSHQISHWGDHKEECERLKVQMGNADTVNEFPFTFCEEATTQICEKKGTRCSFLARRSLHRIGLWSYECSCRVSDGGSNNHSVLIKCWNHSSIFAPCICIVFLSMCDSLGSSPVQKSFTIDCEKTCSLSSHADPVSPLSKQLSCWKDYYDWRSIRFDSPVSLLLQWPLTIYHAVQLNALRMPSCETRKEVLNIHYLGPDKELFQLSTFSELLALLPQYHVHIELVGPSVPVHRDGERIDLDTFAYCDDRDCRCKLPHETKSSAVTLRLLKGFYHDRFRDVMKECYPHLIVAPNAGIAAYPSWKETIELIHLLNVPAVFTDFCEEAAHLAASCLSSVTGCELALPVELNPFRQPLAVEDSVLHLPCYSNCFTFGI